MSWDGKFEGSFAKRASRPNPASKINEAYCGQFKTSEAEIPLAFHHITDWALLRDVWNRMVTDGHFSTICLWLYAVGFDMKNIYYETDAPQSPALITRAIQRGEDVQEVADPDEIHERVTWSTWNLVEGPKEDTRTDDRGNFHDIFSTVRKGLSDLEKADLRCTDNVYTIMKSLNLSAAVQADRARALSNALLAVNRNATVIKFNPEMWVKSGSAKKCWRKNV